MQDKKITNLMEKAKGHDPAAFTELMQFYLKDMYRTAIAVLMNDEDAADAIQDTILACWEKLGTLRKKELFKTWMTRILLNKCYDIRRHRFHIAEPEEYEEPAVNDAYNLELKEALSALDEKYRVPVMLFYGEGYKCKEIAEILHIPESTVQTRLHRGRERLAEYYGERKGSKT